MWRFLTRIRSRVARARTKEAELDQRSAQLLRDLEREINPLSMDEARKRAEELLQDRTSFVVDLATAGSDGRLDRLGPALRQFFESYESVEDLVGGCWMARSEIRSAGENAEFIRIGHAWETDSVQLWVKPGHDTVYVTHLEAARPNETAAGGAGTAFRSIYHWIIYISRYHGLVTPLLDDE